MTNNDILTIEKEHFATLMSYEFQFNRYKVWPTVRCEVLILLSKKKNNFLQPKMSPLSRKIKIILNKIPFIIKYHPFSGKKNIQALAFVSADRNVKEGEVFTNSIYDHVYELFKDQLITFESSATANVYLPRKYNNFKAYDLMRINEEIYKQTLGRFDVLANRNMINRFCSYVGEIFQLSLTEIAGLKRTVKSICGRVRVFAYQMNRLLDCYQPKIIFVHCAVYGEMNSYLINIAKRRQIKIIELQHGNISRDNIQYRLLVNDTRKMEMIPYLPDEIGLLSDYYKHFVSLPVTTPVFGFPFFSKMKEKSRSVTVNTDIRSNIMYVSQWVNNDFGIDFVVGLKQILPNKMNILYRPHPRENLTTAQRNQLSEAKITIGEQNNIYSYLEACEYVISIHSNVIYEALSYGRTVFIIENSCSAAEIDPSIGVWIRSPKDIQAYLTTFSSQPRKCSSFYPDDYQIRYLKHFKHYIR